MTQHGKGLFVVLFLGNKSPMSFLLWNHHACRQSDDDSSIQIRLHTMGHAISWHNQYLNDKENLKSTDQNSANDGVGCIPYCSDARLKHQRTSIFIFL